MERVVMFGWQKSANRHAGQALGEYGLALGLLAIVALSALMFLGGSIRDLLAHAADASAQQPGSQTLSLNASGGKNGSGNGTSPQNTGFGGTSGTSGLNTAQAIPNNVTLKIDPQTGQLNISGDGNSGSNSTSIDGGKLMATLANQFTLLADFKTSDGQPLPDDVQNLLKELSSAGGGMGQFLEGFTANQANIEKLQTVIQSQASQGQYNNPPYYDNTLVSSTVQYADSAIQFSALYKQLEPKLNALAQKNPEYAALQQKIADYAGALSTTAQEKICEGFLGEVSINHVPPDLLNTALASNPNAAPYFQALNTAMQDMTPAQKDQYFKSAIVDVGESLMVGSPVSSGAPLEISLQ